jgi:hypothetical protein
LIPVPYVGTGEAERLFRHRVIALLRDLGLLSEERIELRLSWRHTGFHVHNTVRITAGGTAGIERLGRYLLRSPVSLERLELEPDTQEIVAFAMARPGLPPSRTSVNHVPGRSVNYGCSLIAVRSSARARSMMVQLS